MSSGIVALIQPYSNNALKRVIKAPRMYFLDTGLCAHLTKWSSAETLEAGAMGGEFFETWVVSEIYKSYVFVFHDEDLPAIVVVWSANHFYFIREFFLFLLPSSL